jgi:hypothetical protein
MFYTKTTRQNKTTMFNKTKCCRCIKLRSRMPILVKPNGSATYVVRALARSLVLSSWQLQVRQTLARLLMHYSLQTQMMRTRHGHRGLLVAIDVDVLRSDSEDGDQDTSRTYVTRKPGQSQSPSRAQAEPKRSPSTSQANNPKGSKAEQNQSHISGADQSQAEF